MNYLKHLWVSLVLFGAGAGSVLADAPLDMAATGTTLAGYIASAAGAALVIFAGLYGIRVIIRAFRAVK